jgi:hypothetical protein
MFLFFFTVFTFLQVDVFFLCFFDFAHVEWANVSKSKEQRAMAAAIHLRSQAGS